MRTRDIRYQSCRVTAHSESSKGISQTTQPDLMMRDCAESVILAGGVRGRHNRAPAECIDALAESRLRRLRLRQYAVRFILDDARYCHVRESYIHVHFSR